MRFLNNAKIDGNQLQECLDYLEKSCRIAAFQAKQAGSYNEALVKYGNSMLDDPKVTTELQKATNCLAQAAKEALERHEDIDQIPVPASSMHHAWWATYRAYSAWTSAKNKAITAGEYGKGTETASIENLMKEYQQVWIKAEKEEKRFLKHLRLNTDNVSRIIADAENAVSAEKWEPISKSLESLPDETSLSFSEMDHAAIQANNESSVFVSTELTASVKKRYKTEDVKWLTEFVHLYDQANLNDITRLDLDNMPVDYIATLEGATILPPILKTIENLPRPKDKRLRSLKKSFQDTLHAVIIASEDMLELAECQSNRIPSATIAFDLRYAANMTEQLIRKLGKVLRE
ncbi:MAG: hypothetical protein HQ553_17230 [Chloroflexi bacterium]|nr:hypothetical protein [Chloroflexota bacterium]